MRMCVSEWIPLFPPHLSEWLGTVWVKMTQNQWRRLKTLKASITTGDGSPPLTHIGTRHGNRGGDMDTPPRRTCRRDMPASRRGGRGVMASHPLPSWSAPLRVLSDAPRASFRRACVSSRLHHFRLFITAGIDRIWTEQYSRTFTRATSQTAQRQRQCRRRGEMPS